MPRPITKFLSCPFAVLLAVSLISFAALAAALASEAFWGLEPCALCIYQRWPFVAVVVIGIVFLLFKKVLPLRLGIGLSALAFLGNSSIALYHTGVERKWWASAVEGCVVPNFSDKPQSLLENIMSAPGGSCDEIPWQDPLFGLSMANYNVLLCLGLAIICLAALLLQTKNLQDGHSGHN